MLDNILNSYNDQLQGAGDVSADDSITTLKNLLFRVTECNFKPLDPALWPPVELYTPEERFNNSSIFEDKHYEHLADGGKDWFGTVSSTALIATHSGQLYYFEREYLYSAPPVPRRPLSESEQALFRDISLPREDCPHIADADFT
jgi:hypothetical protein